MFPKKLLEKFIHFSYPDVIPVGLYKSKDYIRKNLYNEFRADIHKKVSVPDINTMEDFDSFIKEHQSINFYSRKVSGFEEYYQISIEKYDDCFLLYDPDVNSMLMEKCNIILEWYENSDNFWEGPEIMVILFRILHNKVSIDFQSNT